MKLTPGMQDGEIEGSWHDAMMKLMPDMKMDRDGMKPGNVSQTMVDAMLKGWREKYGGLPDIEPIPMDHEPDTTSAPVSTAIVPPIPTVSAK